MKESKSKTSEIHKLLDLQIRFDYLTAKRMGLDIKSLFLDSPHE